MPSEPDIRWKQRFQSFDRAWNLLLDAVSKGAETLNPLEKEGAVQRFEYTLELAWKTMKDYLEFGGLTITPATPRQVIKEAFAAGLILGGQTWIDMLDHRNLLAHTYDVAVFDQAVEALVARYLAAFEELHKFMTARARE